MRIDALDTPRSAVLSTEDAILDAALAAVMDHGIRRTSAVDIARRSGLSRQTIYRYWPDVQSLFAALVTRELLAAIPEGDAPATTTEHLVDELVSTAASIRDLPIIARLRETDPELFARYILERLGSSQQAILLELARRFRDGQSLGIVRDGDPERQAAVVLLCVQSAIQSATLVQPWLAEPDWTVELRALLLGYLAPGGGLR